jgi:cyanophycin synthetase
MFTKEVKDINAALYIKAARELGLSVDIISASYSYCLISRGEKILHVYHNSTSISDVATRRVTHNKYLCQKILQASGIPVPGAKLFDPQKENEIIGYTERHAPVVIKPVKGSNSVGVTVGPQGAEEIREAVALARKNKLLVERMIRGESYRILIFRGRIVDVLKWVPPYVVGNGRDSLQVLIKLKTDYHLHNNLHTFHVDSDHLNRQGLEMGYIPKNGMKVSLHELPEHFAGPESEPVRIALDSVHPVNQEIFLRAVKVSGLALAGLDFISEDPRVSYSENGAAVNEINNSPHMWPHYFAEQKEDLFAVKAILEDFFSENSA